MTGSPYIRIAAEEAFAPPEILDSYRQLIAREPGLDPGFTSLMGFYLGSSPRAVQVMSCMTDLGELRLRDMDNTGIAKQILSLTSPGVQIFDAATGTALAQLSNDYLASAIEKHPDRFQGLVAIAPQDPAAAVKELDRGVRKLGLKGVIINSHTRGQYLDDPKFWPIFEAASALNVPIYLHPNTPPPAMIGPFLESGLDGAIYGFAVETGLHMLAANRYPSVKRLNRKPSDYFKENVYVTTSGMAWQPPILYAQSVLGVDRVLYAMDYPYQFVPEEVRVTDELPISEADKRKLYQTNAESVFSLAGREMEANR